MESEHKKQLPFIPASVFYEIFSFIDLKELINIKRTSKKFIPIVQNATIMQLPFLEREYEIQREDLLKQLAVVEEAKKQDGSHAIILQMLVAAQNALQVLSKADITELKAFKNPPVHVANVLGIVYVMLSGKGSEIKANGTATFKWADCKSLISNISFLQNLLAYDSASLNAKVRNNIQSFIAKNNMNSQNVRVVSKAAGSLFNWIQGILAYSAILDEIANKDKVPNEIKKRIEMLEGKHRRMKEACDKCLVTPNEESSNMSN